MSGFDFLSTTNIPGLTMTDANAAEAVLTTHGGVKLIDRGHMYTVNRRSINAIRWHCVKRVKQCRAYLSTGPNLEDPLLRYEHNHEPDYAAAQACREQFLAFGEPLPDWADPLADARKVRPVERVRPTTSSSPPPLCPPLEVMSSHSEGNAASKTIRIAPPQPVVRPQVKTSTTPQTSSSQQQQKQQQPKTLVLKTVPLKLKQVAPTTIKMPGKSLKQPVPTAIPQPSPEVCLRWNSYHSNMQNSFPSLLDSEEFVDVTLACEGRSLKCHKMILSTCSDYLATLLRENPCQHPIILMKDLKFWEIEALVRFMYRGEVNVAHDKLPQLLNAAEALQVKGLAGPSPSTNNSKPPMLIPQAKPVNQKTTQASRSIPETKETKVTTTPTSPKRVPKRPHQEPLVTRPFTKIRLQRPQTPISPTTTIKVEPLDIPLSPNDIFPGNNDDNSTVNYDNLMSMHEEDDPGGDEGGDGAAGDIDFAQLPGGPSDINDTDDNMEFVPSDFLEQEQDIVEEPDGDYSRNSSIDEAGMVTIEEDIDEDDENEENLSTRDKT